MYNMEVVSHKLKRLKVEVKMWERRRKKEIIGELIDIDLDVSVLNDIFGLTYFTKSIKKSLLDLVKRKNKILK